MPKFKSLEDAKRVVEVAKQAYDHNPRNPQSHTLSYIGDDQVTVFCKARLWRVDCAVQQNWMFTGSRKELKTWWTGLGDSDPSGDYIYLKRVKKFGKKGWQVNLQYKQRGQKLFNFHLKVPPKKSS